jgi:hypothetical protein
MIDIKSLKKYLEPIDSFLKNVVISDIERNGIDRFFDYMFTIIDCSRYSPDGMRLTQTIGNDYKYCITKIVYAIENHVSAEDEDYYYKRLLDIHKANLEFETLNPPIIYDKKQKPKTTKRKVKQQELDIPNAPKKQTAAERKLAAKAIKLSALSLSFKPKSHD